MFSSHEDHNLLALAFLAVPLHLLIDFLFKKWSFKIHGRDFRLFLRNAYHNYSVYIETPDFKLSDKIFTALELIQIGVYMYWCIMIVKS